jgi:hypothetical protein
MRDRDTFDACYHPQNLGTKIVACSAGKRVK